jgi:hypothetical protein
MMFLPDVVGQMQKRTRVIKPAYFDVTQPLKDITPDEPDICDRTNERNITIKPETNLTTGIHLIKLSGIGILTTNKIILYWIKES